MKSPNIMKKYFFLLFIFAYPNFVKAQRLLYVDNFINILGEESEENNY